jgi:hypothetical protein
MPNTLPVQPETVYTEGALALALGLPPATLQRARREGRLRFVRQGHRILFLGQWILDWLTADAARQEACRA